MAAGVSKLFHCACCAPPRQIYYRAGRPETVHHEDDHSAAVRPVPLRQRRRGPVNGGRLLPVL